MEKAVKHLLLTESLMINASIHWWKSEMSKVLAAIEKFENNPLVDFEDPRYVELQGKLNYLLKKGNFEYRKLASFKKKVNELP
jgi:hypothetical protein